MDTLTHAISGAVIGAATALPDRNATAGTMRQRALWGGLFAAFPDSDVLLSLFLDHFDYLLAHRGLTHSLLVLPAWAALLGWIAARVARLPWKDMALLAALALVAHICGDLVTSYGTRLFAPVWNAPLSWPITFIIDPIFTAILLAGLVVALWRRSSQPARVSGLVLLAYLSLQAWMHAEALQVGREHAQELGIDAPIVVAFPQPLSPFNWKVVVVEGEKYHRSYINLVIDERRKPGEDAGLVARVRAAYRPDEQAYWQVYPKFPPESLTRDIAEAAWQQPGFSGFRRFALLPYVSEVSGDSRHVCVWFDDLRFTLPELRGAFEYAMCRDENDGWTLQLDRQDKD